MKIHSESLLTYWLLSSKRNGFGAKDAKVLQQLTGGRYDSGVIQKYSHTPLFWLLLHLMHSFCVIII